MKILANVCEWRHIPESLLSYHRLRWDDTLHWFFQKGDDNPADRMPAILTKAQRARETFLRGDYDALLLIDDDMLIPKDALERLAQVEADVAYGLYVRRDGSFAWSAAHVLTETEIYAYGTRQGDRQAAFGNVVSCAGVGGGFTLIRRQVLEVIDFTRRGIHGPDWYFAVDCQQHGFTQKCHTGLDIGHVDVERGTILYPTNTGYMQVPYKTGKPPVDVRLANTAVRDW